MTPESRCGPCRVSASVNNSQSPAAARQPWSMAWTFPIQPGGSGSPRTTRKRGASRASRSNIAPVPSSEQSSTAITSNRG